MSEKSPGAASRRTFLKAIGGAVGAAAVPLRSARVRATERSREYDVIVIGAGFAGITAARELQHAGLRTLVLEARNRLGGRTFTTRVGGHLYELGGTWIHSTQPHAFAEATRYGLALEDQTTDLPEQALWWDGEGAREGGVGQMWKVAKEAFCASGGEEVDAPLSTFQGLALLSDQMKTFHEEATAAFPNPFDPFATDAWKKADELSIRDRLDQLDLPAGQAGLLEGVLGASAHGSFREASFVEMLRWWALSGHDLTRYTDSVARYRFRDGTLALIEAMVDDGGPEIRLGTPVAEVAQDADGVLVTTERGDRVRARAAIAALPMNVIANVRFTPALDPDKVAASRERHAGRGVKVYIQVRGEMPSTALFAPESEPFSSVMTLGSEGPGTELVAFGTDPDRIDPHDRAAVQEVLRRFLPEVEVTDTLSYDWHLDPYSLGTWCILKKGQMTRYLEALRAPHGLVHFAGGDIALGWRGFIDGAIESGNRVAHQVIARLEGRPERPAEVAHAAAVSESPEAEAAFRQCAPCHPTDASGKPGVGPNLRGRFGKPAAGDEAFAYSNALRSSGATWNEDELDAFLAHPAGFAPGTTMPFAGLKDRDERAAVIRLLRQLE